MKTLKISLLLTTALFMATSCSETEPLAELSRGSPQTRSEETAKPTVRTLEEALQYADDWFMQMEQGTRAANPRRVGSVEYLTAAPATRSTVADTLMYLVNYEDDMGFALLGSRRDSRDIYAISQEGRLLMSDTVYNKGLADFMAAARADALNPPREFPDSVSIGMNWKYTVTRQVEPMLPESVSKWGQRSPFNQWCPFVGNVQGVVGCGPVAVGMVMAYYQWPDKIGDWTIPWSSMISGSYNSAVARFLEDLASPEYLNAEYVSYENDNDHLDPFSRSIKPNTVVLPTFRKLKYSMSYSFSIREGVNFNEFQTQVFDFMEKGYKTAERAPILMTGKPEDDPLRGHIFVVDGYAERKKFVGNNMTLLYPADPLLHVVWGWHGYGNGYYVYLSSENLLSKDPVNGSPSMTSQYGTLTIFGRFVKNTFN